jgi:Leucine-rich repeat (LRR) protein
MQLAEGMQKLTHVKTLTLRYSLSPSLARSLSLSHPLSLTFSVQVADEIKKLALLKTLNLRNNLIDHIPENIANLQAITLNPTLSTLKSKH